MHVFTDRYPASAVNLRQGQRVLLTEARRGAGRRASIKLGRRSRAAGPARPDTGQLAGVLRAPGLPGYLMYAPA